MRRRICRNSFRPAEPTAAVVFCGLALAVVLLGILGAKRAQSGSEQVVRVAKDFDTIQIPVPTHDVVKGQRLSSEKFIKISWPKNHLMGDFVREIESYRSHVATTLLPAYMPVPLASLKIEPIEVNSVIERIPRGMRAITISVDEESVVEGWAQSGSFVDVIVMRRRSSAAEAEVTSQVIAENVKILSAGRSVEPAPRGASVSRVPATVTLLVQQEEALRITTASQLGRLTLALRGRRDQIPAYPRSVDQGQVLGLVRKLPQSTSSYRGFAQGPDGRRYVLTTENRWIRRVQGDENGSENWRFNATN